MDLGPALWHYLGMQLSPVVLAFAVIFAVANADLSKLAWGDYLMLGLFVAVMTWLSLPSRDQAPGHEQVSESLAFRFGKALHRVFHRFSRRA